MLDRYKASKPDDAAIGYHLKHLKPKLGDLLISQLSRATITEKYIEPRLCEKTILGKNQGNKVVSAATVRRELDTLSAAIHYAKREGYLSEVPFIDKPAASPPRERWLTHHEVSALFTAAAHNKNLTAWLHLAICTAARPAAILQLKWFQVDLEKRLIHFNPDGRKQNKKHRPTVYINDSLMEFLPAWLKKCRSEYVCGGVNSVRMAFNRACQKAEIKGATPYTLRHTAITWAVRDGHSLALAGQLAGHKDPRTTMRYAKHDPSFTEGVVSSLATGAQLAHKIAEKSKNPPSGQEKRKKKQ